MNETAPATGTPSTKRPAREWCVELATGQTTHVVAEGFDVYDSGALAFWNLGLHRADVIELYAPHAWVRVTPQPVHQWDLSSLGWVSLPVMLRRRADEIEARKGEGGSALVMLLRDAADALEGSA